MVRAVLCAVALTACASTHPSLVGRWRVTGCETSPEDPADCGRGSVVFTANEVTLAIGEGQGVTHPYKIVSSSAHRVVLLVDDEKSEFVIDAAGAARWQPPGGGGRVGRVSFVREK